jgi:hAT family C-terminal dimerisation region
MTSSDGSPIRVTRKRPRRDYNALNNGIDSHFPPLLVEELDEASASNSLSSEPLSSDKPIPFDEPQLSDDSIPSDEILPSDDHCIADELLPSESASQVVRSSSSQQDSDVSALLEQASDILEPPRKKRKEKSRTSWTAEHFDTRDLNTTWSRNGGPPKIDRVLICKRCNWSSKDSARKGATTNLATHLFTRHRIKPDSSTTSSSVGSLDGFMQPTKRKLDPEQALLRWMIETQKPFTELEHPAFKELLDSLDTSSPIKTADTLRNRVQREFLNRRGRLKQDLASTCHSISLSLDLWTSENQVSFLGVIGHWLTHDFEKREELLDFIEIEGRHSGENLAESVKGILEVFEIAHKLLTLTGDNAGNNLTLCDFLHAALSKSFEEEDHPFRLKPLMRFRGRASFIPCLAHVINLICKDILASLKAGSAHEAQVIFESLPAQKSQSSERELSIKSAIVKIRLLVLWISDSPQRKQAWKEVSPSKQISYDVDTRWNSTYIMISDAIRLRKEVTQFVRNHSDIQVLQLADGEWSMLQQIQKVLKPFWDHTNAVSTSCPTIVESLPIYWNLDDILDDIKKGEGDFQGITKDIQDAAEAGIQKMNKFAKKMDGNILYYVAAVLDPRIKTSVIRAQMNQEDANVIVSQVREFLKKQYPLDEDSSSSPERPSGMPESLWRTLKMVHPVQSTMASDIDRYLDSMPVNWSHRFIEDGDPDWVLKWWKANAFNYPLMSQAVRDYFPVPSAEVGVERLFSNARDVLGIRRHCLNAETFRWLMFLKGQYDKERQLRDV